MKTGLIIGKFMPLHNGHIALIAFARERCDELIVLVSASNDEAIPGGQRLEWLQHIYRDDNKITPRLLNYDDSISTDTNLSSDGVSRLWANYLKEQLPHIDMIFASEAYGAYMGRFFDCEVVIFDEPLKVVPVSSQQIMNNPAAFADLLPDVVKQYYNQQQA